MPGDEANDSRRVGLLAEIKCAEALAADKHCSVVFEEISAVECDKCQLHCSCYCVELGELLVTINTVVISYVLLEWIRT